MTSLIRSLLALGVFALLHAASAQSHEKFPGPFRSDNPGRESNSGHCATFMFGERSQQPGMVYQLPTIHITEANSYVKIDDPYAHVLGTVVIGEEITVCNRDIRGPTPVASLSSHDPFNIVKVMLGFNVPPPVDIDMYVTRFRKVVRPDWYQW